MRTTRKRSREGGVVILLLAIILLVGLLTHQTVRTLWILRRSQDQQSRIQQATQLLEIGRSIDQRGLPIDAQSPPIVVQVGEEYGRLEAVNQSAENGSRGLWVAKLPVDASGNVSPEKLPITVSCERSTK
jgi:hypothetical protein